ncbi:MAG: glycoside hydrolase [Spirochaetales bacterium]|nr:glycoside hydrolase [Spirochaetales bacterium]
MRSASSKAPDDGLLTKDGNTVTGENFRFTILTSQLIRMEFSPQGLFEDRPTRLVQQRDFPSVSYRVDQREDGLVIDTPHLTLRYSGGEFRENSLEVALKADCHVHGSRWRFGQPLKTLKGTTRTLDEADGAIPLDEGLVSQDGFSYLDDSNTLVFEGDLPVPRNQQDAIDGYFFGYGHDYFGLMRDYFQLSGATPRLPRYALGNWWSRYWPYTQEEYLALIKRFRENNIPFSVGVIDMDWHIVDVEERFGGGWTGYTWNHDLIPEPREFMEKLHQNHLQVSLNLHPASGVRSYEKAYPEMAQFLGVNPKSDETLPLRLEDPQFMQAYFRFLHHPLEEEGVDFWWIDWQQGSASSQEGMDPLWLLNHYHTVDMKRRGKEALILSRYAGFGSHRYPVGFSGDTVISWDSLAFQPYFTSTAANAGYNWWSHDIGGHMQGTRDSELSVRWLQFGVFSPICRLHSSRSHFNAKEPWNYPAEYEHIMGRYLRLRHELVPYLYTLNCQLAEEGRPFLTPLYYHHPNQAESYGCPHQYYFGDSLMVRALTTPRDAQLQVTEAELWLPPGLWCDFFTGRHYQGGGRRVMYRDIENQLVLAKCGAVIPMSVLDSGDNSVHHPEHLEWLVFAGGNGDFTLKEDGEHGRASTRLENLLASENALYLHPVQGALDALPPHREMRICLRGVECPEAPSIRMREMNEHSLEQELPWTYDAPTSSLHISIPSYSPQKGYVLHVEVAKRGRDQWLDEVFSLLHRGEISYDLKDTIHSLCQKLGKTSALLSALWALQLSPILFGALSEILLDDPYSNEI